MVPNTPETEELLTRARKGESAAVDTLLQQHREPLRRMISMRLDPALAARVDASDVVQDVLLEASRRRKDYLRDPCMPFHLWLRHLARDHIIDAYRRHRLAQRRSLDREQPLMMAGLNDRSSIELAGQLLDRPGSVHHPHRHVHGPHGLHLYAHSPSSVRFSRPPRPGRATPPECHAQPA